MKHEVWMEGYVISGGSCDASFLGMYEGETFSDACKKALISKDYEMILYDLEANTFWGCRFFNNEIEARKSFG